MSAVNEILDFKRHLVPLRGAYNASRSGMTRMLQSKLPAAYDPSRAYVDAAMSVFYDDPGSEDENAATREKLSVKDRERCIIAMLASRGADYNLALHLYMGLMEGISPGEIANVLLLAGVYTGVDNFAEGISVEIDVLMWLKNRVEKGEPLDGPTVAEDLRRERFSRVDLDPRQAGGGGAGMRNVRQ